MSKIYAIIKVYTHFTVNKPKNLYHLLLITLYFSKCKTLYVAVEDYLPFFHKLFCSLQVLSSSVVQGSPLERETRCYESCRQTSQCGALFVEVGHVFFNVKQKHLQGTIFLFRLVFSAPKNAYCIMMFPSKFSCKVIITDV